MQTGPTRTTRRRGGRAITIVLLTAWCVAAVTGFVGLFIAMVSFGTARLPPLWEATFAVGIWVLLLTPVVGVIGLIGWMARRVVGRRRASG